MPPNDTRKPGERGFAVFLAVASLILLYNAYGISGFEALSGPGAIPMAASLAMVVTSIIVVVRTSQREQDGSGSFFSDVLPARIAVIGVMLVAYALALKPVGFLPTSAVFLVLSIKFLSRRSWFFSGAVGVLSLITIYLVFRIVFTVLMPAGIVPEGELLAWFRGLFGGGV